MQHMKVTLDLEDGAWAEHADKPFREGEIVEIGARPNATSEGRTAIAVVLELEDGSRAIAWTTHRLFNAAAQAFVARHGNPNVGPG